jgi:hypothetical protein
MVSPPLWNDPAGPLTSFAQALGFDAKSFNESPEELTFHNESFRSDKLKLSTDLAVKVQQVAALDGVILEMKRKYGSALTLKLKLAQDELNADDEYTATKLETFCNLLEDSSFELDLRINKRNLPAHWSIAATTADFKVFLFPEALARSLQVPLTNLEQGENALMPAFTGEKKLIILVPDHKIDLDGEYLSVLGDNAVDNWKDYVPAKTDEARAKVARLYEEATTEPHWGDIHLTHLTPLQLYVGWNKPGENTVSPPAKDDLIARPLYSQLMACSLLYLATYARNFDATRANGGETASTYEWLATFKEDKYLASIEVGATTKIGDTLVAANETNPWEASQTIGALVIWAYKEVRGTSIRLALAQAVIASVLQDTKASANLLELARSASERSKRVFDRWEAFMNDKLDKYFSSIKALEEAVETTSKSYNEQVQALNKTLIDNILAAVGVVVGSFLVAIFKYPFQTHVFRFGTVIYLIYLAIFPVGIGLFTAWQRFKDSKDLFAKRLKDFSNRLGDQVKDIVGVTVSQRERKFQIYFGGVCAVYLIILALMALAIWIVPRKITRWNDYSLSNVSYGTPIKGTIPITIRGENFDKDKEIVVIVGNSRFTNTTEPSVRVQGSTALIVSPRRKDLVDAIARGQGSVTVRQADGEEKSLPLPAGAPPTTPDPVTGDWIWVPKEKAGVAIVTGSNLDSIAEIRLQRVKRDFQMSSDGTLMEFPSASKDEWQTGKVTGVLVDGRPISLTVRFAP